VSSIPTKQKDRYILVLYDFSASAENALKHGIKLSFVLQSKLCIATFLPSKIGTEEFENTKKSLASVAAMVQTNHDIEVIAYAMKGKMSKLLHSFSDVIETVLVVVGMNKPYFVFQKKISQILRIIRRSRIPYFIVPENAKLNEYTHIILPVSYTRQDKEKIAWASYFARLNQSTIHALIAKARDGFIRTGISNNVQFLNKMYSSLNVYYKLINTDKDILKLDAYAIEYAVEHNAGLVMTIVPERADLFDLILGSTEKKNIMNVYDMPILCISPRDDMYVLCS